MCIFAPKIPKQPPPAQMQAMQAPKDMARGKAGRSRRRGMWANIFTGPSGIAGPPSVTGGGGGFTGG